MAYTIYMHKVPNGKVYIGITSGKPTYRFNYGRGYKGNAPFYNDIIKYGWENIEHIILEDNLSQEDACIKEKQYISKYDSVNPLKGYNKSIGGQYGAVGTKYTKERLEKVLGSNNPMFGKKHTEETKCRISQSKKGVSIWNEEQRKEMSLNRRGSKHPRYGTHWTDEQKIKLSKAHKGKKKGQENGWYGKHGKDNPSSRAVLMIDINTGLVVKKFDSISDASKETGSDRRSISKCCNGKYKQSKGFEWRFAYE